jgi:archaeosine synthase
MWIKEVLPDTKVVITTNGSPTGSKSLKNLENQLKEMLNYYIQDQSLKLIVNNSRFQRSIMDQKSIQINVLNSIARFQFGEVGAKLIDGCNVKGRYPNLKIFKSGQQLGMLTGERGLISLTFDGAKRLFEIVSLIPSSGTIDYVVNIDDFKPKGSIMAVGVQNASAKIRNGDEVIACFGNELRAVGQAIMSGAEMIAHNRGIAVKVRHHIK